MLGSLRVVPLFSKILHGVLGLVSSCPDVDPTVKSVQMVASVLCNASIKIRLGHCCTMLNFNSIDCLFILGFCGFCKAFSHFPDRGSVACCLGILFFILLFNFLKGNKL